MRSRWQLAILVAAAIVAGTNAAFHLWGSASTSTGNGLISDTSCAFVSANDVDLGVEIDNSTGKTITLTGATLRGLPSNLVADGIFAWAGCDPTLAVATIPPVLAPHKKQWVLVDTELTAICPGAASPEIIVSYTEGSARNSTTLPLGSLSEDLPPCSAPSGWHQ